MNITKKLKEIEDLEKKQAAGEKLAANQLPKLEKKKVWQEELKSAEAMLEPWQEVVSGMVVEMMKPLHGVWVEVPGYETSMPLYAAHCDPPIGADDLGLLLRKFRINQKTKVRVLRDKTLCQMSEEDEAENKEVSEGIMKQLESMKEEAERMEEEWKKNHGYWSNWYDATVKSTAKFGVFLTIGPSADILVPVKNMPADLIHWDSDLKETVPDRKEICVKSQVKVRVRYMKAKDCIIGSMLTDKMVEQFAVHTNGHSKAKEEVKEERQEEEDKDEEADDAEDEDDDDDDEDDEEEDDEEEDK